LYRVQPDGSTFSQTINSQDLTVNYNTFGFGSACFRAVPSRVIPDGQNGLLALWMQPRTVCSTSLTPVTVSHITSSGNSRYNLPLDSNALSSAPNGPLVLGENGVAFATDSVPDTISSPAVPPSVVSSDVNSGEILWTYQAPSQESVSLIASGGGPLVWVPHLIWRRGRRIFGCAHTGERGNLVFSRTMEHASCHSYNPASRSRDKCDQQLFSQRIRHDADCPAGQWCYSTLEAP
jgi:hypothetical protein